MRLMDFDYHLPSKCIAQRPSTRRDRSRLMVLRRRTGDRLDRRFFQIVEHLDPGDVLVLNDTRVMPGRLNGIKDTGGRVELLLTEPEGASGYASIRSSRTWKCLARPSARTRLGQRIHFAHGLQCMVQGRVCDGQWVVRFECKSPFWSTLLKAGKTPLPPYIKRNGDGVLDREDRVRYQTVYSKNTGSAAAPTAGFHFTRGLLQRITERGVEVRHLTLHVGTGTFLPVREEEIEQHRMHSEFYVIPPETAASVNAARAEGRRVVAVGTTTTRALEHAALSNGLITGGPGRADLFIRPGYQFRIVNAMVTNFHLPRSTLIMLVCALAGRDNILEAYREAIRLGYRFYSYGDAMFIG